MARLNNSLFAYRPGESLVHKMPAWAKLVLLAAICIRLFSEKAVFFSALLTLAAEILKVDLESSLTVASCQVLLAKIIPLIFYSVIIFGLFFLAKTPLSHLKKLRFVVVLGTFVILARAVSFLPSLRFDLSGAANGALYTARLFLAALLSLVVFETTSRLQIMEVFEGLEKKLRKAFPFLRKLPLSLTLSLTLSFIPEIFSVWEAVTLAAAARNPRSSKSPRVFILKASALFSCMLSKAESVRRAVANRSQVE